MSLTLQQLQITNYSLYDPIGYVFILWQFIASVHILTNNVVSGEITAVMYDECNIVNVAHMRVVLTVQCLKFDIEC